MCMQNHLKKPPIFGDTTSATQESEYISNYDFKATEETCAKVPRFSNFTKQSCLNFLEILEQLKIANPVGFVLEGVKICEVRIKDSGTLSKKVVDMMEIFSTSDLDNLTKYIRQKSWNYCIEDQFCQPNNSTITILLD
jgi:hypothetical protein